MAASRSQGRVRDAGASTRGSRVGAGMDRVELRKPLRGDDQWFSAVGPADRAPAGATGRRESVDKRPARGIELALAEEADRHQRIVQLVGAAGIGALLVAHPIDGGRIESTEIVARPVRPAPCLNGVAAPLFERRVVEKRVRLRAEDLVGEDRGFRRIPRDERHLTAMNPGQHGIEAGEVHGFFEAVADGLSDERMIRDFAIARNVLEARGRIREDRRQQVRGEHPLQLRRELPAAARAGNRERNRCVPPPPRLEHRRVEERLHEHVASRLGVQIAKDVRQRKRVLRAEREHEAVLGGRGLQLEVELTAEALAERQAPRFRDAASKRRVQHELHAAGLVKEPLEDERVLRRNDAERAPPLGQIRHGLLGRLAGEAAFLDQPRHRRAEARLRG